MKENDKTKIGLAFWFCVVAIISVLVFYFDKFGTAFKVADLGTFGDYFGGLLNPIFAAAN
ncbi:hypothetical protein [Dyadobacter alkalitolerans]|uniref:hypothetical protein n=1 Tax=Dyadobacter alkalitolerans TaxID=492736 RepID=UPI0012FCB9D2|nr:hypothetical protein [Dyadobacter alkalitolerans]